MRQINNFKGIKASFEAKNRAFSKSIADNIKSFSKAFPDFDPSIDIYAVHSFDEMDGGTRKIDGKLYFIFGIDGLAKYHDGFTSEVPFFHHELFHIYHHKFLVEKDNLWVSLWSEGLATYVSDVLNPGAGEKNLLLDTPSGMFEACKKAAPALWSKLKDDLDSESESLYEKYFLMSSKDSTVPKRAGYYLGYLIVKQVARKYSLSQLVKLDGVTIKKEIIAAIDILDRSTK